MSGTTFASNDPTGLKCIDILKESQIQNLDKLFISLDYSVSNNLGLF